MPKKKSNMESLMGEILDNACPSTELENGWKLFYIETHCVAYWVEAKPIVSGLLQGKWLIRKTKAVSV